MSGDKVSLVPTDSKTVTLVTQDMLERLSERVDRLERALDLVLGVIIGSGGPEAHPLSIEEVATFVERGRRFREGLK